MGNMSPVLTATGKKPMHWSSKVPKKIKRNIVTNDLHRAKKIRTDFENEKKEISKKYKSAGYPKRFVESIVKNFEENQSRQPRLHEEPDERTFIPIRIPFARKMKK